MEKRLFNIIFLSFIITLTACEKWDLDKVNFITVETGLVSLSTATTMTIESEILGFESGRISEHGHLYSCTNSQPVFGQDDTEVSTLGIKFEKGIFTNTLEELTLNTTYYVRAFAFFEDDTEAILGEIIEVNLGENQLNVTTDSVTLFPEGFELFGTLSGLQSDVIISRYGFVWSNDSEIPSIENDEVIFLGSINADQPFSIRSENIESLKNYHIRAFVQLGNEVFYGETKSFFKGDQWIKKSDVPFQLESAYFVGDENIAFVGGGFNGSRSLTRLRKYNPLSDTWETESSLPGVFSELGVAFTIDQIVYTATGLGGIDDDLWAYDTVNKTWSRRNAFPGPTLRETLATTIQGKGYIGGGFNDETGEVNTDFFIYDPQTDTWEVIFDFPEDRFIPFIFSNEDELIIGFGNLGVDQTMWCFNVETKEWSPIPFSPLPDVFPVTIKSFSIEGKGYALMSGSTDNFWEYDIQLNTWKVLADYPGISRDLSIHFTADGNCYYGLGQDLITGEFSRDLWEYIPNNENL